MRKDSHLTEKKFSTKREKVLIEERKKSHRRGKKFSPKGQKIKTACRKLWVTIGYESTSH